MKEEEDEEDEEDESRSRATFQSEVETEIRFLLKNVKRLKHFFPDSVLKFPL